MNNPVFIVGAGPVGLTMATELARYGIAVRIVDKASQRTDKSKALVLWSRTPRPLSSACRSTPQRCGAAAHADLGTSASDHHAARPAGHDCL
jgi:2-polyprenyl-6-methoxyphenol hydroxylase-like FAD-dependent oxidoreductase